MYIYIYYKCKPALSFSPSLSLYMYIYIYVYPYACEQGHRIHGLAPHDECRVVFWQGHPVSGSFYMCIPMTRCSGYGDGEFIWAVSHMCHSRKSFVLRLVRLMVFNPSGVLSDNPQNPPQRESCVNYVTSFLCQHKSQST